MATGGESEEQLVIADSKALYRPPGGLARLETSLLAALTSAESLPSLPRTWGDTWQLLAPGTEERRRESPWYCDYDCPTPLASDQAGVSLLGDVLANALASAGVQLAEVRSRAVFPAEFNDLLSRLSSKGELLSRVTLQLLAELLAGIGDEHVLIHCDKHGGRNRYGALLQQTFPDHLVEIAGEGRSESVYTMGATEAADRNSFHRRRRAVSARGIGFDDQQVPSRAGDAGVQHVLATPGARAPAHRRLSCGR